MPKRVDRNQKSIVEALRKIGATVWHTHEAGKGDVPVNVNRGVCVCEVCGEICVRRKP